jgi:putative tryptophan/tyrosine transport system substrate-binding protein
MASVIDRRAFIMATAGGVLAVPLGAAAQEYKAGKVYRIGFLGNQTSTLLGPSLDAFRLGLRELGWIEGQNVAIEYRWADGDLTRLPALASDLAQSPLDVLLVAGPAGVRAAQLVSGTVPIVVAIVGDPVKAGFAASFAQPGGNVTGLAVQFEDLATKQLQLLKEAVPLVDRVAFLDDQVEKDSSIQKAAEQAARTPRPQESGVPDP